MSDSLVLEDLLVTIQKLEAYLENVEKEKKLNALRQRRLMQKARSILGSMSKKEERILERIDLALQRHEKVLEGMLEINKNIEETLCNVLLAIRQNEYLQAYYPAQNGKPEQKVVGKYEA